MKCLKILFGHKIRIFYRLEEILVGHGEIAVNRLMSLLPPWHFPPSLKSPPLHRARISDSCPGKMEWKAVLFESK